MPTPEEIIITDTYAPPEDNREVGFINEDLHQQVTVSSAGFAELTSHAALILSFNEEGPPEVTVQLRVIWYSSDIVVAGDCFTRMRGRPMRSPWDTGITP